MIKAIGVLSGGLDSRLATKIMIEQGIEIEAVNFKSVFWTKRQRESGLEKFAREIEVSLTTFDINWELMEIIKKPKHGYGSGMNPCIDCHILMFKKAGEYRRETGAQFIFTGEVLGERPMSQKLGTLKLIEREAGLERLILRPLSAKLLAPTMPEEKGWVNREKLFDIQGRSRKRQIELAEKYGLKDYPAPAGGCLLTDPEFSKRLKDLLAHTGLTINQVELLKIGRHFRVSETTKLIVGRNKEENQAILALVQEGDWVFDARSIPGPLALARGPLNRELKILGASIAGRYSDAKEKKQVSIKVFQCGDEKESSSLVVSPAEPEPLARWRI